MRTIGLSIFLFLVGCQRQDSTLFAIKNPPSSDAACYEVGLEYCLKIIECDEHAKQDIAERPADKPFECAAEVGKICAAAGLKLNTDEMKKVYDECLPALRSSNCSNYEQNGDQYCPMVETEKTDG